MGKFHCNNLLSTQPSKTKVSSSFSPTGGGKSITFQLPALMRGKATNALTVVISPLVSLMKDQVDNLKENFDVTNAVAISGLLSPLEREEAVAKVEDGTVNLLYLSPESLRSGSMFRLLSHRIIDRFVIDEAHCFSHGPRFPG
ncbi:MAG: DEAD/DEAH box helicase [Bacteroidetes bacterium]|nr:DEAD/DEAH box helicase [Bacteroidota bacterium]